MLNEQKSCRTAHISKHFRASSTPFSAYTTFKMRADGRHHVSDAYQLLTAVASSLNLPSLRYCKSVPPPYRSSVETMQNISGHNFRQLCDYCYTTETWGKKHVAAKLAHRILTLRNCGMIERGKLPPSHFNELRGRIAVSCTHLLDQMHDPFWMHPRNQTVDIRR